MELTTVVSSVDQTDILLVDLMADSMVDKMAASSGHWMVEKKVVGMAVAMAAKLGPAMVAWMVAPREF